MMLRNVLLIASLTGTLSATANADKGQAPTPPIVPQPWQMKAMEGAFALTGSTKIVVQAGQPAVRAVGEYLADWLRRGSGLALAVDETEAPSPLQDNIILFTMLGSATAPDDSAFQRDERYILRVDRNRITLRAAAPQGLFRGVQSLKQLLPPTFAATTGQPPPGSWHIPGIVIEDKPRYRWRGMLLDCCRHFMTKEFVKRYIDLLAYHKMNVLHWHLTEDQGWRIEIKKYPKLTEVGAWRGKGDERYGGFYTQQDVREIVAYAASRYITVVPEIEMPGHSVAALAAYPELSCTGGPFEVSTRWGIHSDVYCAGNEQTFAFLEGVLSEVLELFPSEFIHIGGDECPKQRWKECTKCQARIKAEGLTDENALQSYFIRRMEEFLNAQGRRLVGWDEILEGGLAPNATVQSWRGMSGAVAAAGAGHDVISSPTSHCYLDYAQARAPGEPTNMGFISLATTYSFEPTPPELGPEQAKHVLGAEGNMWTEHAPQDRVDHQVFPRLCALAEVTWSPAERREWDDFSRRMETHYRRLDALGVTYCVPPPRCTTRDRVFSDSIEVVLEDPQGGGDIRYTLDGNQPPDKWSRYTKPLRLTESAEVQALISRKGRRSTDVAAFRFVKQQPRPPVEASDLTPGLAYAYYEGEWRRLPDFDELTAVATGTAGTIDLAVRQRDDRFAVRFSGYLQVPADGIYTFYLTSDDGSRLWVGSDLVVDHDGLHGARERAGQIILQSGKHPLTVAAFQAGGARALSVDYQGPNLAKQRVPATALWRSTSP
ncbi:MAG: family 20 glycosylhydrolase [bacterium]|nr:family 20 glycosylhydrolase [bacterium]